MAFILIFWESVRFAFDSLRSNLLRTLLSLLGITVGIFSIISSLTVVDALDSGVKKSLNFLGEKVIYVQKWPWSFGGDEYPWWKYMSRPEMSYKDFEYLESKLTKASAISLWDVKGNIAMSHLNNSIKSGAVMGCSFEHNKVSDLSITSGRYFIAQEIETAKPVAIVGVNIAEGLFGQSDPIGKTLKIKGLNFTVIGVLQRQGKNLLGAPSNDNLCLIPYNAMLKMYSRYGLKPTISVKGFPEDKNLEEVEAEVRGLMRARRSLKPLEEDDFALNRPEFLKSFIDSIISNLWLAGWFIGGFSMLIGVFGIVNIMFVTVKERTNLIGIQKALGAKKWFIISQFLSESVMLSLLGGGIGLILVTFISVFSTDTFVLTLSAKNIAIGLGVSSVFGVLAGIVPAIFAAELDPVVAIRSK
jgi:putative ABC transport system permease protein